MNFQKANTEFYQPSQDNIFYNAENHHNIEHKFAYKTRISKSQCGKDPFYSKSLEEMSEVQEIDLVERLSSRQSQQEEIQVIEFVQVDSEEDAIDESFNSQENKHFQSQRCRFKEEAQGSSVYQLANLITMDKGLIADAGKFQMAKGKIHLTNFKIHSHFVDIYWINKIVIKYHFEPLDWRNSVKINKDLIEISEPCLNEPCIVKIRHSSGQKSNSKQFKQESPKRYLQMFKNIKKSSLIEDDLGSQFWKVKVNRFKSAFDKLQYFQ